MEPLISVIVPIYNVEKYLARCIDSILGQTYNNLEIILVDDGSPDNCGTICDKYATQDSRIKVLHIKNGGVSNARNIGIEASKGEYIGFVDADDVIFSTMYECLLSAIIKDDADIVQCNYCYLFEDGHTEKMQKKIFSKKIENAYEAKKALVTDYIYPLVATKLFKREVIGKTRFNATLKVAEDRLFMYECCGKASKIILRDEVEYYYFQRVDSVMHSFNIKQFIDDNYVSKIFINEHLKDKDIVERMERRIVNKCVCCVCGILRHNKYREQLENVRKELFNYWKIGLLSSKISLKTKIYLIGICFIPKIFYIMYSNIVRRKEIHI